MAITYTPISSNTLASAASSVTFSSIPSSYTDLILQYSVRHDGTGGNVWFFGAQFNSDTTSTYSDTYLVGTGATAIASRVSNGTPTDYHSGAMVTNNYTSNTFSNGELYIPSYTGSHNKSNSAFFAVENNATAANYYGFSANLWRGTSAISQIVLKPNGSVGNFAAGSSFYLYGISKS